MISVDFKSYNRYVTDSLYQWDLNRELKITGLGVKVAPVVVFSNRHIDRGIVVQSSLSNGVITCKVPNALLQFPCPISANLCDVSDQEYKAYETVLIPVIPRVMPADYLFSDNIPILTYQSLKADLSTELAQSYQSDLEVERNRIDSLAERLDNAIAPGGAGVVAEYDVEMSDEVGGSVKIITNGISALVEFTNVCPADLDSFSKNVPYVVGTLPDECLPFEKVATFNFEKYKIEIVNNDGEKAIKVTWLVDMLANSPVFVRDNVCYPLASVKVNEIADIRVGIDGTVYNSAGEAVRAQISKVVADTKLGFNTLVDFNNEEIITPVLELGGLTGSTGATSTNKKRVRSGFIPVMSRDIMLNIPTGYQLIYCLYDVNQSYICMNSSGTYVEAGTKVFTLRSNARYIRFMLKLKDETGVTELNPFDVTNFNLLYIADNKSYYEFNATDKVLTVYTPKTKFVFKKCEKPEIQLNAWRLYEGYLRNKDSSFRMWVDSDAEGVLQLAGTSEVDAVGGYHGDELDGDIAIYIDGVPFDIANNSLNFFKNITIICNSKIYHCDSDVLAFLKTKKLVFTANGYSVQNKFTAQKDVKITRGALALFQSYKGNEDQEVLKGIDSDDIVGMLEINPSEDKYYMDKKTTSVNIYTSYGLINLRALQGYDNEYYTPFVRDFPDQNRNKVYLDMYNGASLSMGDEILSKFEVTFI